MKHIMKNALAVLALLLFFHAKLFSQAGTEPSFSACLESGPAAAASFAGEVSVEPASAKAMKRHGVASKKNLPGGISSCSVKSAGKELRSASKKRRPFFGKLFRKSAHEKQVKQDPDWGCLGLWLYGGCNLLSSLGDADAWVWVLCAILIIAGAILIIIITA